MKTETESKVSTYEAASQQIEKQIATLEKLKPAMQAVDEVAALVPELNPRTCTSLYTGSVLFSVSVTDLRQLKPVARGLIVRGFHPQRWEDSPEHGHRRYHYGASRNWYANSEITIYADIVKKDGAKCEFKQTGVKEQPVYELVCDGGNAFGIPGYGGSLRRAAQKAAEKADGRSE